MSKKVHIIRRAHIIHIRVAAYCGSYAVVYGVYVKMQKRIIRLFVEYAPQCYNGVVDPRIQMRPEVFY